MLGGVVAGAAAGEDAVGQGQAADVGAGAQAGRAAAGRVQAVDRAAVGAQDLAGPGVDDQAAEGEHRRRVEQAGPDRAVDQRERRLVLRPPRGGGLSRGVGRRRVARRGVIGGQRGLQPVRVEARAGGDRGDGGRADRAGQQVPGLQPLEPQRRPAYLAAGLGQRGPVGQQPGPPAAPHDRVAERGTVARLVADPVAVAVHQHAAQQGGRRAEEAPDRDPVQERGRAAGAGAEPDAAAIVARGGQRQPAARGRRVRAHHRPVRGEAAGRDDHAAGRPDPSGRP